EHFAETYERYLVEGKAPSIEMRDAFGEFRVWILNAYKSIQRILKKPLPKEISGVFDRMLATDEAIAEAETVQEYAALFTSPEQSGTTVEAFALYKRGIMRAHNEGVDKETQKIFDDMKRSDTVWWKDALKKIRAEVEKEAHEMPVFKALAMLRRGKNPDGSTPVTDPFRLDRDSVVDTLHGDKTLSKTLSSMYRIKGGVDVDLAAPVFGFKNGQDLVQALLFIKDTNMERWIDSEANARMSAAFPDPALDGSLVERAIDTVHTERRAEILMYEMRKLRELIRQDKGIVSATKKAAKREDKQAMEANKAMLPKRAELAMIKKAAEIAIGRRSIRDVKPHKFLQAERKAGRLARQALERKDYQTAYEQQLIQIKNFEMYRAAMRVGKKVASTQKYLSKFQTKKRQEGLKHWPTLRQILAIIENVDFKKKSLKQVDRDEALKSLRIAINGVVDEETGQTIKDPTMFVTPETAAKIMDDAVNWQNLKVDEFLEMGKMVKQLVKQIERNDEMMVNDEMVSVGTVKAKIIANLYGSNDTLVDDSDHRLSGYAKEQGNLIANTMRSGNIGRTLDRAEWGPLNRWIVVPIRVAMTKKLIPWTHKMEQHLAELWMEHYTKKELAQMHKKDIRINSANKNFSKFEVIMMLLNWGTQSNRDVVLNGRARNGKGKQVFSQQTVDEMLSHVTETDAKMAQAIWDYRGSWWDGIPVEGVNLGGLKEAYQRRLGVAPEKIEGINFTLNTADGKQVEMRGQYIHLAYDANHSAVTEKHDVESLADRAKSGYHAKVNTRAGASYERTKNHNQVVR
ncbi:MAG: hypothetical protein OEQ39_27885, partial [Gammaproteobacteria bacterium]|nr:hypothetical protein [Gammaproteobacteria bacterium]